MLKIVKESFADVENDVVVHATIKYVLEMQFKYKIVRVGNKQMYLKGNSSQEIS